MGFLAIVLTGLAAEIILWNRATAISHEVCFTTSPNGEVLPPALRKVERGPVYSCLQYSRETFYEAIEPYFESGVPEDAQIRPQAVVLPTGSLERLLHLLVPC